MLISKLAELTGVSPRALRHYEDCGLLVPRRTSSGYRTYADSDVTRVAQIKAMIAAGLSTDTIGRYLDCARSGDHGVLLDMCPDLRAELATLVKRLEVQQNELKQTQERLVALSSP